MKRVYGEDNPGRLHYMRSLAELYADLGRSDEALALMLENVKSFVREFHKKEVKQQCSS